MSGLRPLLLLIFLGSSWGLYFSLLKIAVLSGISYVGILTLTTVGVGIGMTSIALLRGRKPEFKLRHNIFLFRMRVIRVPATDDRGTSGHSAHAGRFIDSDCKHSPVSKHCCLRGR